MRKSCDENRSDCEVRGSRMTLGACSNVKLGVVWASSERKQIIGFF